MHSRLDRRMDRWNEWMVLTLRLTSNVRKNQKADFDETSKRLEAHDGVKVRVHAKTTAYQYPQHP